jgi:hypothetical protein
MAKRKRFLIAGSSEIVQSRQLPEPSYRLFLQPSSLAFSTPDPGIAARKPVSFAHAGDPVYQTRPARLFPYQYQCCPGLTRRE